MPTPCVNCLRFHYGDCYEAVKQCFECRGFGHIERYCPNRKNQIQRVYGQPLAGTRSWCEMHGLDSDPDLKKRVLNALKTNPGSAIYVNDVCIYLGSEKHFDADSMLSRGRTLEERMKCDRARSRSPRSSGLSRSPLASRQRGRSQERHGAERDSPRRYRDRSPIRQRRRTPSPYQLPTHPPGREPDYGPRSPRYAHGSNAVVYEARDRNAENRGPRRETNPVKFNMTPPQPNLRKQAPAAFNAPARGAGVLQARDTNSQAPKDQSQLFKESQSQASKASQSQMSPPPWLSQTGATMQVEDPHFVLGITRGAGREEIVDAYQQRMAEVEAERKADQGWDNMVPNNVWDESRGILNAAKRQLLGY